VNTAHAGVDAAPSSSLRFPARRTKVLHSRVWLAVLVGFGLLIRLLVLPLPGTRDMAVWKIWTYNAAVDSPFTLYGVGGSPPERRVLAYHGATTVVNYPPLALIELSSAGRAYRWWTRGLQDSPALGVAIKLPVVLFEAGFVLLVFFASRRLAAGRDAAQWAACAYWLNPAAILDASVLAYLDPLFVLPLAAALLACCLDWPLAGGMFFAASALTKPQAIIVAPALALAVWNCGGPSNRIRRITLAIAGSMMTGALVVGPIVAAGAWPNMIAALRSLGRQDMLSGNACNFWWVVTYLLRAWYAVANMGVWGAFTAPVTILSISRTVEIGFPNLRLIGTVMASAVMCWGLWTARRARDPFLLAAVAAFLVHVYATLSVQVHENHLFAAVPLLVIAGSGRPGFRPVMWTLSAIVALNLNLFYGISEYIGGYSFPRAITIVDATVILAGINCVALAWHAQVLRQEAQADREPLAPGESPVQPFSSGGERRGSGSEVFVG